MLLAEPEVALLDEPFSKLDKELRVQFRDWVMDQLKQANIPTLMVTHDEDDIPQGSQVLKWPWESAHA
ncbi:ABC transporter ATP-binding protein YnjD [Vibrio maritimus]|uniref:ABC transporter ATP-binding protein YnjD n=1 Tax=Vibrio maritimus TaxID=990268 RepID=A0A090RW61_9VIBR|nr:ABC transporter ATP-binding protein YnjD [Vibrio maritimus]